MHSQVFALSTDITSISNMNETNLDECFTCTFGDPQLRKLLTSLCNTLFICKKALLVLEFKVVRRSCSIIKTTFEGRTYGLHV